jgi:hypothetical protein
MPINVNKNLTPDLILQNATELDIYRCYIGNVELNEMINSPLRGDDHTPSFRLYTGKDGKIRFVDYGTGVRGGVFDLVSILNPGMDFSEVLNRVWKDIDTGLIVRSINTRTYAKRATLYPEITVHPRKADDNDILIWGEWGITPDTLKKFKVSPIDMFWIDNARYVCRTPSYAYDLKKEWKVYRPFEKKLKFISGGPTLQGYDLLPEKGDICVIQKSYKDVMLMYEFGIPSFAPQAESINVPKEQMESILNRFKKVYIWGDPDTSGRSFAQRHSEMYGIITIHNDDGTKDITDHCKDKGKESAEIMTKRLLQM